MYIFFMFVCLFSFCFVFLFGELLSTLSGVNIESRKGLCCSPKCNNCPKCNKVLNVITFGPKCNKVLNVITFGPKCNKPPMQSYNCASALLL